jgi:hypothetical protein
MLGFEILFLAIAQAASPSDIETPPTTLRRVPIGTLVIPDEIAPAVVPYMSCLYASRGIAISSNGVRERPVVAEGADCVPHRERAARRAERMLRDQGSGSRDERRAYVEAVLGRLEAFVVEAERGRAPHSEAPAEADEPAAANGSPEAIEIPYQALPAFRAYSECVNRRYRALSGERGAAADETRQAYEQAISACRPDREAQLRRALDALTDMRLYRNPAAARAAVRSAFDRFDSDFVVEPALGAEDKTDAED